MTRTAIRLILAGVAGLAGGYVIGSYVGFSMGRRVGAQETWAIAEDELVATEDRLKRRYKVGEYASLEHFGVPVEENVDEELLAAAEGALREYAGELGYDETAVIADSQVVASANVFDKFRDERITVDIESYEVTDMSNPNRDDPEPYIIEELEFMQDMEEYDKISVAWYPGDRVLADVSDVVIDDVEGSVGLNNLNQLAPNTKTIIFVRNNRLRVDFEVAIELGSYAETVLGIEAPVEERPRRKASPKKG